MLSLFVMSDFVNLTDHSPPGSSVHRIFQARILEQVANSYSRWSSWPRDQIHLLHLLHWQVDSLPLGHQRNSIEDKGFYKWNNRCVSVMCNYVLLIEASFSIRFLMIECLVCGLFSNYNQSFLTWRHSGNTSLPLFLDLWQIIYSILTQKCFSLNSSHQTLLERRYK